MRKDFLRKELVNDALRTSKHTLRFAFAKQESIGFLSLQTTIQLFAEWAYQMSR